MRAVWLSVAVLLAACSGSTAVVPAPDLASSNDLTIVVADMAAPFDLATAPDLTTPPDLVAAVDAAPDGGAANGDPCGPSAGGAACAPGLACCYPCGIPMCVWRCRPPCQIGCVNGCPLVP